MRGSRCKDHMGGGGNQASSRGPQGHHASCCEVERRHVAGRLVRASSSLGHRKIDLCAVHERRWFGSKSKESKVVYNDSEGTKNGAALSSPNGSRIQSQRRAF